MAKSHSRTPADAARYDRGELAHDASALFGVRPEIAWGALYGAEQLLTYSEASRLIQQFMKRKVK